MSISAQFDTWLGEFHLEVDFTLPGSGISAIYGPSGSGKTSLLRAIAGLEHHSQGQLVFGQEYWQKPGLFVPPHRRPVGYVFQEASLFDHLDVQGNLEYGWHRIKQKQRRISLQRISELLDLGALAKRRPDMLSGGERQRVAIGRALAVSPQLLLMDEPLASLDQRRRDEILPYLLSLHREFALPIIYVSHDRTEISRLADHLLLLDAGRVIASDNCQHLLTRMDLPLAHEESANSIFDAVATAVDQHYQLCTYRCGNSEFIVPGIAHQPGEPARLLIASRDVSLALSKPQDSSILNIVPAVVEAINAEQAGSVTVSLRIGDNILLSRITSKSVEQLALRAGMSVFAQVKSIALSGSTGTA